LQNCAVRNLSRFTCTSYRQDLNALELYTNVDVSREPKTITQRMIRNCVVKMRSDNLTNSTIARRLSCWRNFFKFLYGPANLNKNPVGQFPNTKIAQRIPHVIDKVTLNEKIDALPTITIKEKRDHAMIEIMYGCGLRVSECANLKVRDLNLADGIIFVRGGKGDSDRIVPIGPAAIKAIRNHLKARGNTTMPYVFDSRGTRLSTRQIQRVCKKALKEIRPHDLRHCAASHLVDNGADIRAVQDFLGHSNLNTTARYVHVSGVKLKNAIDLYHPKSKKNDRN
jgi:site-specific recombinase XerD